jgi:dipeptidyl aminopeptidase/acylaminoacyl peptidase
MSPEHSYYVLTCKGPGVPATFIHRTATNDLVQVYDDNAELQKTIRKVELPSVRLLEVPVSGSDLKVQVKLYLPPDFDPRHQYPAVVNVYGGPGYQLVDEQYNQHEYQTYLAGSKGFVYIVLDPRGSGGQGDEWRHSVYKAFGTVEVQSTIEAAKYLQKTLR